jgi:hypothetical protein
MSTGQAAGGLRRRHVLLVQWLPTYAGRGFPNEAPRLTAVGP